MSGSNVRYGIAARSSDETRLPNFRKAGKRKMTEQNRGSQSRGWFRAMRSEESFELMKANKNAFLLLYVIAYRAQWKQGFNRFNLTQGEALLGDYETYGLSEREYRTAKQKLEKWGFATFKATSDGTIATLTSTSIFSITGAASDDRNDTRQTDGRRASDGQTTTTKTVKKKKTAKEGEEQPPEFVKLTGPELIVREKELERVEERMRQIKSPYDAFQTWSDDDREEFRNLKARKAVLVAALGMAI